MTEGLGGARRAAVVRKAESDLRDIVESARLLAATAGRPIDEVDDSSVLAGLRRLNAAVTAHMV